MMKLDLAPAWRPRPMFEDYQRATMRFGGRPPRTNRRDGGGFHRQHGDDGEGEIRQPEESRREETNTTTLAQVLERLERLEKFDSAREDPDRRGGNLGSSWSRGAVNPPEYDDEDDWGFDETRRMRNGGTFVRGKNPNWGLREGQPDTRLRRDQWGRHGPGWTMQGTPNSRLAPGGFDQSYDRPPTCWDPPQRYQGTVPGFDRPPGVKMDPPRFDGSDATNWIARVQYYFNHLMMPEAQRLHYAVMLFDQPAAEWVFNYCANNEFVTWNEFLGDVRHRFDRKSFQNYFGLLAKLTQTGSLLEYHNTFEKYLNRVHGVPESELFTLFVAGLKPDIQERVKLHRPESLAAAMALILEWTEEIHDRGAHAAFSTVPRRAWQNRDGRGQSSTSAAPTSASVTTAVGQTTGSVGRSGERPRPGMIRVSQAEKAERARQGLCYYCPEKWIVGHVCKQRLLCYAEEDDENDGVAEDQAVDESVPTDISHIHAMDGGRRSRPMKVVGCIQDHEVCVLIDTGSDRDFLHPKIAESLHLPLSPIRPFKVVVGNGGALLCTHVSKQTKLEVQGSVFLVDLHILPIHGPDVILGMDWLESLGKVTADFAGKTLEFTHKERPITLKGVVPPPRKIDRTSLAALMSPSIGLEVFEIMLLEPETTITTQDVREDFPADLTPPITTVLETFRPVFNMPSGMPPSRPYDHRVHLLPGTKPINVRPYRYPYFQKNEIERQVKEMLEQGIIQRSNSPFSSPVLLIRKKDGTFRFCIDYRALNTATVPDHFPIPTADELFDELGKARVFTKLDLRSGYHQIRMHDEDVFKTAFRTHDGHFEFLVMPFGLTNAPSTFQAAMNAIFQPMLRKFVIVFFDDILVYSPTMEVHEEHLSAVLMVLQTNSFVVKLSKCSFCKSTVEYLGHLISNGSLKADPNKISAMTAWPKPKNVRQLRGFLGLTGYYRRFIAGYALIASPLTDLLKKDAFVWTPEADSSFLDLKGAMTTAPVLRLPDFDKTFCVETDASNTGIGAVLLQDNHPIAFFSKKLGPRRRVASTYHKELYAIVESVQKWRQYLLGREFVIRSDQRSLKELLHAIVQTPDQQLYARKLMGYKFRIEYKKGSTNRAADALSRREEAEQPDLHEDASSTAEANLDTDTTSDADEGDEAAHACALLTAASHPIPHLVDLLRRETSSSPEMREITRDIKEGRALPHLSLVNGLVYYNRRIFVSSRSSARTPILIEYHSSKSAGHPGFERTLRRVTADFYWPNMKKEVKQFVEACVVCQTTKYSTQKPAGLLQPLPIPSQVWEDVSMDFITGLPQSRGYTVVMVAVDRLSKYAHFAPLPTNFDTIKVANVFIDTVVRHHGFPKTLVSDRDSVFLNQCWKDMMRLSGTKLNFSTAYHPQSDGQTEVRNRGLEQYLRAFTADRPSKWSNFLPWAELALNCFHHAALGMSPYKALYGRDPPSLIFAEPSRSTPPEAAELIRQRGELLVELRRNLERAQQRMRESANKHRRHLEFKVGDLVLLKLQPYRQHSVARPRSAKLARRYYGPFEVLERIGPVAYRLRLPEGSRIHNVFHVSLLRAFVAGNDSGMGMDLPSEFFGDRPVVYPVRVLDRRMLWHDDRPLEHVLVRWSDGTESPTWEPLELVQRKFPNVLLEDKETFMEAMRNKAPKTIFTDQDSAMANAIGKVFPNNIHRLCVWHISKNATQHISHLLSDSQFKAKFNKMLCEVEMENEMAQLWRDLCEGWNVAENKWLSNMYLIRHKWYPAFNRDSYYEKQAEKMRENQAPMISNVLEGCQELVWIVRWTKSARLKVQNDDSGSCSLDLTSTRTYHLKELMRQSFDVMSLSVHDVETVKIAKKRLHELDVEIRNYVSSSDNNTKRTEDNDVPQVSPTQILDPLKKKSKGMTNSRMKSGIEKRKKGKSLKGKGPLQQFHGGTPFYMTSIQPGYAQPITFPSLLTQDYQSVASVPENTFPSDCPP
ncbi:uncharacterized protein LOC121778901 [Salvia splendens]|uniref:uncharacterized protein LOC121778901 n=1 Tax=Salvia splendens TaxID=180675 RepID=UPI001C27988A|nr:uncharacterized protein LOC121778901 [Salvia splendens]